MSNEKGKPSLTALVTPDSKIQSGKKGAGPLGGLVRPQLGQGGLSAAQKEQRSALSAISNARRAETIDLLGNGRIHLEIALDLSASSSEIHNAMATAVGEVNRAVHKESPLAKVTFGGFGGGDMIYTGNKGVAAVEAHQATDGWESTLGRYLMQAYDIEDSDSARPNVLFAVNDARPKVDQNLLSGIQAANRKNVLVIVAYYPSPGSTDHDKQALMDLTKPELGGFNQGIFVDLTELRTSPEAFAELISKILGAVVESRRVARGRGYQEDLAKGLGHARLQQLVHSAVVTAGQQFPRLLTGKKNG